MGLKIRCRFLETVEVLEVRISACFVRYSVDKWRYAPFLWGLGHERGGKAGFFSNIFSVFVYFFRETWLFCFQPAYAGAIAEGGFRAYPECLSLVFQQD